MTILIVSDAWFPQVNGVVRTLSTTARFVGQLGHRVEVIGPDHFRSVPCPTYPEIRLVFGRVRRRLETLIEELDPDAIHIPTEGPLGWATRNLCVKHKLPFTTSFHTFFPDYVHVRFGVPRAWSFGLLRHFHGPSRSLMVSTLTMESILRGWRFRNIAQWPRGVDVELFRPGDRGFLDAPRPIQLFVGRLAPEKNLDAFLSLKTDGTKYVVGDGPQMAELRARYPSVRFVGAKHGEELARYYAAADVFVFPSRTETFGLVMLEALACGVPVAAYPVQGPLDIVTDSRVGALDEDLGRAVERALGLSAEACRAHALNFSWESSARIFLSLLHYLR